MQAPTTSEHPAIKRVASSIPSVMNVEYRELQLWQFLPNNLEAQDLSESNSDGDGGEHLIEQTEFPKGWDISSGSEDDSFDQARR